MIKLKLIMMNLDVQCKFDFFDKFIWNLFDDFSSKETHQVAQANDEKNRKLREAFGIGEYDKKLKEKQKAEEAREAERRKAEVVNRQYT